MAPRNLDRELEGLRKQEANKTCMSCGLYSAFGFRDVCVRYAVFCCSNCKAAHQAYSHRCKSLGQSTFTEEEVDALAAGGNAAATARFLAALPPGQLAALAPRPEDKPTDWHAWIAKVFEELQYAGGGQAALSPPPSSRASASSHGHHATPPPPPRPPQPPPPAAAPLVDLLGFDDAAPQQQPQQPPSPPAPRPAPALFDLMGPPQPASDAAPPSSGAGAEEDAFGDFLSAPATPVAPPGGGGGALAPRPAGGARALNLDALYSALPGMGPPVALPPHGAPSLGPPPQPPGAGSPHGHHGGHAGHGPRYSPPASLHSPPQQQPSPSSPAAHHPHHPPLSAPFLVPQPGPLPIGAVAHGGAMHRAPLAVRPSPAAESDPFADLTGLGLRHHGAPPQLPQPPGHGGHGGHGHPPGAGGGGAGGAPHMPWAQSAGGHGPGTAFGHTSTSGLL